MFHSYFNQLSKLKYNFRFHIIQRNNGTGNGKHGSIRGLEHSVNNSHYGTRLLVAIKLWSQAKENEYIIKRTGF